MKLIDLVGKVFGRLTVVARAENRGKQPCWLCRCSCGEVRTVRGSDVRAGTSKSCGCLRRELASQSAKRRFTRHGHARAGKQSRTYRSWIAMRQRCNNPNNVAYHYYGGREENPVTISLRW